MKKTLALSLLVAAALLGAACSSPKTTTNKNTNLTNQAVVNGNTNSRTTGTFSTGQ